MSNTLMRSAIVEILQLCNKYIILMYNIRFNHLNDLYLTESSSLSEL